ncbi:MAG TPA: hypothetical protein VF748_14915 [Candidatus Acidoferrum sp.]
MIEKQVRIEWKKPEWQNEVKKIHEQAIKKSGIRSTGSTMIEKFQLWLAWKMPRRLVYWCAIRLLAHATTGKYSATLVSDLRAVDALDRWNAK